MFFRRRRAHTIALRLRLWRLIVSSLAILGHACNATPHRSTVDRHVLRVHVVILCCRAQHAPSLAVLHQPTTPWVTSGRDGIDRPLPLARLADVGMEVPTDMGLEKLLQEDSSGSDGMVWEEVEQSDAVPETTRLDAGPAEKAAVGVAQVREAEERNTWC